MRYYDKWIPRRYYVLKNRVTGLKYVGQTTIPSLIIGEDYLGSGVRWKATSRDYGSYDPTNIDVLWIEYFSDESDALEFLTNLETIHEEYWNKYDEWANSVPESTETNPFQGNTKHAEIAGETRKSDEWKENNKYECPKCGKVCHGKGNYKQHYRSCVEGKNPFGEKCSDAQRKKFESEERIDCPECGMIVTESMYHKHKNSNQCENAKRVRDLKARGITHTNQLYSVCVDRNGNRVKILKEIFQNQKESGDNREYVGFNAKEGKRRCLQKQKND